MNQKRASLTVLCYLARRRRLASKVRGAAIENRKPLERCQESKVEAFSAAGSQVVSEEDAEKPQF